MKEPNLIVENPPDGFKKLAPIQGLKRRAPKIKWGQEYLKWKPSKRIRYLEELASTMNHAADVLQQEKIKILKVFNHQEKQIVAANNRYEEQTNLLNKQLASFNAQKQELLERVAGLERENGKLKKEIAAQGNDNND